MKIGIITFWWADNNYGQLLQCYALQKYLKEAGHTPYIIRYKYTDELKSSLSKKLLKALNPVKLFDFLTNKINNFIFEKHKEITDRHFKDFLNKYIDLSPIEYKTYEQLKNNPPQADIYIVGSDQVWNPKYIKHLKNVYFLNFGTARKFSYAASWGTSTLSQEDIEVITPLLKKFEAVSVREKSGIDLCNQCGYENAEWVCDPTLLLSDDDYRQLYKNENITKPTKPYIFLYMLKNKNYLKIKKVYEYAKKNNLEVIHVTGNMHKYSKLQTYATIPQWLFLIDNAQFIITNSYHCGVFSLIFNKKFGIVPLSKKYKSMNTRIDSLFSIFNVEERYINNNNFDILKNEYESNPAIKNDFLLKL